MTEDGHRLRRASPLGRLLLVAVGLAVAVTLTLFLSRPPASGPVDTAPRLLVPTASARQAVEVADDSPALGFRTVVVFLRDGQYPSFVEALRKWAYLQQPATEDPADVLVVLPHALDGEAATPVAADSDGKIARAFGMPVPTDGGPPVGYAIVDAAFRIRYVTLDERVAQHLDDVAALLEAAR